MTITVIPTDQGLDIKTRSTKRHRPLLFVRWGKDHGSSTEYRYDFGSEMEGQVLDHFASRPPFCTWGASFPAQGLSATGQAQSLETAKLAMEHQLNAWWDEFVDDEPAGHIRKQVGIRA